MSESLIKVPGYKIPGYKIERELGRGGMATVYLALQESLNRHVALKVMNPVLTTDEDFKTRFLNEGHIVGQLSHSNIVTVFDIGVHENHYYLSMELLRGGSLREKIQQGLPLGQALNIAKALGNALGYAHQRGFIHRDIKPLNVLFREDGSPVLTDFGIAKALGSTSHLTRTGYAFGSVGYMSPEQSLGKPIDHRADIYSFGVMVWEMLTGKRLYESADAFALALKHATAPIPSLPPELDTFQPIMQKLLAKQPEERYDNTEQFVADIERLQYELALTDAATSSPKTGTNDRTIVRTAIPTGSQDSTAVATAVYQQNARKSKPADKSSGAGSKLALAAVLLLALGGGGYVWLQSSGNSGNTTTSSNNTNTTISSNSTNTTATVNTTNTQPPEPTLEERIAALLDEGKAHAAAGRYIEPADSNAFKSYSAVLQLDSENAEAKQALAELGRISQAQKFLARANELFQQGSLEDSLTAVELGLRLVPDSDDLLTLKTKIENGLNKAPPELTLEQWLAQAKTQWELGQRFEPPGDNAFESYQQALRLDAGNETARQALLELGRERQAQSLAQRAAQLLEQGKAKESLALIEAGLKIAPEHPELLQLRAQAQASQN